MMHPERPATFGGQLDWSSGLDRNEQGFPETSKTPPDAHQIASPVGEEGLLQALPEDKIQ
ncbi:MAG: hypothetical protein DSY87_03880 [Methylococcus sp.]|nr:MAG: hypothetical protein DSY87_03880 [Methylococcus sp.]